MLRILFWHRWVEVKKLNHPTHYPGKTSNLSEYLKHDRATSRMLVKDLSKDGSKNKLVRNMMNKLQFATYVGIDL